MQLARVIIYCISVNSLYELVTILLGLTILLYTQFKINSLVLLELLFVFDDLDFDFYYYFSCTMILILASGS